VPNLRTMVTEIGTGLGMLGLASVDDALSSRPAVMRSLSPEDWDVLASARSGGAFDAEFHAAWENGRAFLAARDGLRGRLPEAVEWKGSVRAAGDEVAPVDLRVDHVYLVSCKYLSNILFNVAPAGVFDALLVGGQGRVRSGDWYAEVAPARFQQLYEVVRRAALRNGLGPRPTAPFDVSPRHRDRGSGVSLSLPGLGLGSGLEPDDGGPVDGVLSERLESPALLTELPERALDMTSAHRAALSATLKSGWPDDAKEVYGELATEVATLTAQRWRAKLAQQANAGEAMLWRLLRMGSAPYFVLGSSATQSLRLRIATPWDWRQQFSLGALEVFAQRGGQPRVGWLASIKDRNSGQVHSVEGHIEIRWSHGRFSGPPEAKGYIDTPHHLVPGYFPLS
jgi:hypothetical protein